jgi:hypothetical protein
MEVLLMKLFMKILVLIVLTAVSAVIAEQNTNNLSSYFGFGDIEIIKLDWEVRNMRICDLNGDGRNDIIAANNKKSRIELLIQKEAIDSNDVLSAADIQDADINTLIDNQPTRFKNEPLAVSENIYSLVCGDLNSDGLPDLAYLGEPKGLYVVLQKKTDANEAKPNKLSWETRKKIKIEDAQPGPSSLVCADLTNDGKADLIVAAPDKVYLIEQKKDGTLAEPVKFPVMGQIIGIDVADVDGDGIGDLIIVTTDSEKPLQIRFGLKSGKLGPLQQFFIERPWSLKTYNVDGKPGDEILVIEAKSGRLICYKFSKTVKKAADWPMYFYPLVSGESDNLRDIAAADFDGDGLTDVAISNPSAAEITLYKQQAGFGLTEPVSFPTLADITSLSAADIDGDGKSELAVLSVKEKIIGISKFTDNRLSFSKPLELAGSPVAMQLADVDSDGKTDCVYVSKNNDNAMFLQTCYDIGQSGTVPAGPNDIDKLEPAVEIKKLTSNPDGLKIVDVDQDGLNDVLIFVKYESPIFLRQVQKRKFEVVDWPTAQASLIKEATLTSTSVCNVDGKEGKELLIAQKNFARSLVFSEGKNWTVLDQYNAKGTDNRIVAAAAFNIDQKDKQARPQVLLLDSQKGQLQVLKYGDDKTYRLDKELNVGRWETADHLTMLYEPLTGGREKSILLFDGKKFAVVTPPADSNGIEDLEQIFTYETKIKDGLYGNLTAGDINSDEIADIILVEYKNNNIEILTFDDKHNPVSATKFRIYEEKSYSGQRGRTSVEPRELEVSDVTGDGKADLVTLIHDRIIIYPQD